MSRRTPLAGARNFRDLGGYARTDGRRIRWGRLYRSGALASMDARARRGFHALGITVVCDLRRPSEREAAPHPFDGTPVREVHIPIDPGSAGEMYRALHAGTLTEDHSRAFMIGINRQLVLSHAADYRRTFEELLAIGDRPFLVNCTAGKDRTGLWAALILSLLGISRELILEDYLLSNAMLQEEWEGKVFPRIQNDLQESGVSFDLAGVRPLFDAREEYLQAALDEIDRHFGSTEGYLQDAVGVGSADIAELEARLLE